MIGQLPVAIVRSYICNGYACGIELATYVYSSPGVVLFFTLAAFVYSL